LVSFLYLEEKLADNNFFEAPLHRVLDFGVVDKVEIHETLLSTDARLLARRVDGVAVKFPFFDDFCVGQAFSARVLTETFDQTVVDAKILEIETTKSLNIRSGTSKFSTTMPVL
jgi:hypothetical protein